MEITYEVTVSYMLDEKTADITTLSTIGPCAEELVSTFVRTMLAHGFALGTIAQYINLDNLEIADMFERREY